MSDLSDVDQTSRVEKLKKKFDVTRTRSAGFINQVGSSTNVENALSSVLSSSQKDISASKGNIRRTPAFRCDKLARSRNVVAHSNSIRGRPQMVADRVKLFEDSKGEIQKSGRNASRIQRKESFRKGKVSLKSSTSKLENNSSAYSVSAKKSFPVKKIEAHDANSNSFGSPKQQSLELAKIECEFNLPAEVELTENLKKALMSPLPSGPPPKKPPRTFEHKFINIENGVESQKSGDPTQLSSPHSKSKISKTRMKSEMMLQKLENILSNNQATPAKVVAKPKNISSRIRNMIDKSIGPVNEGSAPKHLPCKSEKSNPVLPYPQNSPLDYSNSERDKNDSFLASCLEPLSCGSSRAPPRPDVPLRNWDEKQTPFCLACPAPSEVNENFHEKNSYGTLHKCKSEEHLYAEPNIVSSHVNLNENTMCHKSFKVHASVEDLTTRHPPLMSVHYKTSRKNFQDLHYMCTPLPPKVPYDVGRKKNVIPENCSNMNIVPEVEYNEVLFRRTDPDDDCGLDGHCFQCIVLVEMNLQRQTPVVKYKFPIMANIPLHIGELCFPRVSSLPAGSRRDLGYALEGNFPIINTEIIGKRFYGYCRHLSYCKRTPGSSRYAVCILSPVKNCSFYFQILSQMDDCPVADIITSFEEIYNSPFPNYGESLQFIIPGRARSVALRPGDPWLEVYDFYQIFSKLGIPIILFLFVTILSERSVLLFSHSVSFLASSVWMLTEIISPFSWQRSLITVLPYGSHIDSSSEPYIYGILKPEKGTTISISLDKGMVVDIDTLNVIQATGDELDILPKVLQSRLENGLQAAIATSFRDKSLCNVLICKTFLNLFIEILGKFEKFYNEDDVLAQGVFSDNKHRSFMMDYFLASSKSKGYNLFLELFVSTELFRSFVEKFKEGTATNEFRFFRYLLNNNEEDSQTEPVYGKRGGLNCIGDIFH